MNLIKSQNESIDGNIAILKINIGLLQKEVQELEEIMIDRIERLEIAEYEEAEEELALVQEALEDMKYDLRQYTNGHR